MVLKEICHIDYSQIGQWVEPWLIPADRFKNTAGKWQELDAIRVAPLKGTAFSEWPV